jgi:hypothetical protein
MGESGLNKGINEANLLIGAGPVWSGPFLLQNQETLETRAENPGRNSYPLSKCLCMVNGDARSME